MAPHRDHKRFAVLLAALLAVLPALAAAADVERRVLEVPRLDAPVAGPQGADIANPAAQSLGAAGALAPSSIVALPLPTSQLAEPARVEAALPLAEQLAQAAAEAQPAAAQGPDAAFHGAYDGAGQRPDESPTAQPELGQGLQPTGALPLPKNSVRALKALLEKLGLSLTDRELTQLATLDRQVAEFNSAYGGAGYHGFEHQSGPGSVANMALAILRVAKPRDMTDDTFKSLLVAFYKGARVHDVEAEFVVESQKPWGKRYARKYANDPSKHDRSGSQRFLSDDEVRSLGEPLLRIPQADGTTLLLFPKAPNLRSYLGTTLHTIGAALPEAQDPLVRYFALKGTAFSLEELRLAARLLPKLEAEIERRHGPDALALAQGLAEQLGGADFFNHYVRPDGVLYSKSLEQEFQSPFVRVEGTFEFFGLSLGGQPAIIDDPKYAAYYASLPAPMRAYFLRNLLYFKVLAEHKELLQSHDIGDLLEELNGNSDVQRLLARLRRAEALGASWGLTQTCAQVKALETGSTRLFADSPEALFRAAHPRSKAIYVLGQAYPTEGFSAIANNIILKDVFNSCRDLSNIPSSYRQTAAKILAFADRADSDPAARRFVRALARLQARQNFGEVRRAPGAFYTLPPNPLGRGDYWDLASGPNGSALMMGPRDPNTRYVFFDRSEYVVELLKETKRLMASHGLPAPNVVIIKDDVRQLARPPTPLAVLRSKNVHSYVPGFENELERMTDWIAEGGALVIPTDPGNAQRAGVVEKLGPMIERLISRGWRLNFDKWKSVRIEHLTLIRPKAGESRQADPASLKTWRRYVRTARP